jgi:preprotein translocase subunit SecF
VIADRVRELFRANPNGRVAPLINSAVKATLTRTMITSGTTFGTVACLWLLGGAPLQGFAIALCLGIVSGTWSSISVGLTIPQLLKISPNSYAQASYDDRDDAYFEEDYSAKVSRAQQR